jgi:hypothetical protein
MKTIGRWIIAFFKGAYAVGTLALMVGVAVMFFSGLPILTGWWAFAAGALAIICSVGAFAWTAVIGMTFWEHDTVAKTEEAKQ